MAEKEALVQGFGFADFLLDARDRVLWHGDHQLALTPRSFDVLALLISRAGRLVTKQELFDLVWRDIHVTDSALTQCIKDIRKLLGDTASNPRYIKTTPKRGYTFIAPVAETFDRAQGIIDSRPSRPYKFLSSFTEADAAHFFGREQEIRHIVSRIGAQQTFLLYGRSGAGKSSLLAAGLVPALQKENFRICLVRTGENPRADLERALAKTTATTTGGGPHPLVRQLLEGPEQPILCFDRFENLFRLTTETAREAFLEELARIHALPGSERLRFVFVLREDYLAQVNLLKDIFPNIFHAEFRLGLLDREQASRAMVEPARLCGCRFEPELERNILQDLSGDSGVDPPFLQILCDRLFEMRTDEGVFTMEAYRELGGAPGILQHYLDRVLLRLEREAYPLARHLLLALVSPEGAPLTRPLAALRDQVARDFSRTGTEVDAVLEALAEARIVIVRSEPGEVWVELVHDFLVSSITPWMTGELQALARIRDVLHRAQRNFEEQGLLMGREELELVLKMGPALKPGGSCSQLLLRACLARAAPIPRWLAEQTPDFENLLQEALARGGEETRLNAVPAAAWLTREAAARALADRALFDEAFSVRKAACVTLAQANGDRCVPILGNRKAGGLAGLLRFLVSLAIIRDTDRDHYRLFGHGFAVGLAVMAGLALVRLRRQGAYLFQRVSGGVAGATVGSCLFAIALAVANGSGPGAGLALAGIGAFAGLFVAIGTSLAVTTIELIGYRHQVWWQIPAGMVGGCLGAAILHGIGKATGETFLGIAFSGIGGWREGLFLAAGACTGGMLFPSASRSTAIPGAALACGLAAVLVTSLDGHLFTGSLHYMANQLSESFGTRTLPVRELAGLTGQLAAFAEGALFGGGLFAGFHLARRWNGRSRKPDPGTSPQGASPSG